MADKGWIKLHRQLQDCFIWNCERFSKGQAWVDLLLLANHSDKKIMFNGEMITVKRGQYITSMIKLADKWGWNRKTVSSYLNTLQKERMITKQTDSHRTLITIDNYCIYQSCDCDMLDNTLDTQTDSQLPNETDSGTDNTLDNGADTQTDTNNNVKNDKNVKNEKNNKKTLVHSSAMHDTEMFFDSIWKLYPIKKGKGSVSAAKKKTLQKIGYEELKRCVERFVDDMEKNRPDRKYWMHGSTFFNSGYVDYLDKNYLQEDIPAMESKKEDDEPVLNLWDDEEVT